MKYVIPLTLSALLCACGGGSGSDTPPPTQTPDNSGVQPPPNNAPVASDDSAETINGQSVTVNVLGNDSDADNDDLTIDSVSQPSDGTVSIENNQLVFTPSNASFAGTVNFSYTVSDSEDSASANVSITVNQAVSFDGIVVGAESLNGVSVRVEIGEESFESELDTEGRFALDYQTSAVDSRDVSFALMQDQKLLYVGTPLTFDNIVARRGSDVLFSYQSHKEMLVSPVSTAVEALRLRLTSADQQAFEAQIDGDTLLQLAAISSLIAKGELTSQDTLFDVLNDDAQLEALARSLLLDDEAVSVDSENQNGVEGIVAVGTRLQTEMDEVRSLVAPLIRIGTDAQTNSALPAAAQSAPTQANSSVKKTAANTELLADYYQLKPSYEGRIASYNFVGAQLTLMQDGTGTYFAEHASSSVSWEEGSEDLIVTLDTPIPIEFDLSLTTLNVRGLIDPEVYSEAINRLGNVSYTTFMNSFTLTRLFNGENVDIISTDFEVNVKINEDPDFPPETYEDARELGVDDYLRTLTQDLEYVETALQTKIPFTAEEVTGVWGFAIAGSAPVQSSTNGDVRELAGVFADLVTFDADGSMQSQFHDKAGTWQINDDGTLTVNQTDGYEVTYTRISQDEQANGMLIRASNQDGASFSQFRMAIKRSSDQLDLSLMRKPEFLWNGNWGLSNPNNYNADGSFKNTGYFGFQFSNDETVPSYLLGFLYRINPEVEIVIRNRARHLVEGENNLVYIERRSSETEIANADCDVDEPTCRTWLRRQWTPLGQTEDRYYVLEHFYFNTDLIFTGNPDAPLYFQPRGRVIFYEKLDYPEGLVE